MLRIKIRCSNRYANFFLLYHQWITYTMKVKVDWDYPIFLQLWIWWTSKVSTLKLGYFTHRLLDKTSFSQPKYSEGCQNDITIQKNVVYGHKWVPSIVQVYYTWFEIHFFLFKLYKLVSLVFNIIEFWTPIWAEVIPKRNSNSDAPLYDDKTPKMDIGEFRDTVWA